MIKGIDVSHQQGDIDWKAVAASGVQYAFIKATEGITVQDAKYQANLAGAESAGIAAHPYHFFIPMDDADRQADNFLAVAGKPQSMALDLEYIGGDTTLEEWAQIALDVRIARVQKFLARMKDAGVMPVIYIEKSFYDEILPGCKWLNEFVLWICHYNTKPGPLPDAWTDWYHWQYNVGTCPGVKGPVDLDYLNDGSAVPA